MSSGVYALLDCDNTVRYVGQSSNIEKRFRWHRSKRKWPAKWILLKRSIDREERLTQEREWVRIFGGHLQGHFLENKTLGGDPGADCLTMKTRSMISTKSLSMWADPLWRARQCKLIKEGINKNTQEYRKAVAVKRWNNPKTAASIKAGLQNSCTSEEYRQKKREIANKIFSDPAIRKKLSEAQKRRWANPAERERAAAMMHERMRKLYGRDNKNE